MGKENAMKVRQLMNSELVTIAHTATIYDAALKMKEECVGSLLVMDDDEKLAGIVTDRDIAMAVAGSQRNIRRACVCDIMTSEPVVVTPETDVDEALKIMNTEHVRRLPVCNEGEVVGMLSSTDVAAEIRDAMNQLTGIEISYAKHL